MKYRELFEMYKSGRLDDAEREKIENDIERHEVIGDYLYSIDSADDLMPDLAPETEENNAEQSQEFVKKIKSIIRRTLIKVGACAAVIAVAVTLLATFALPKLVDKLYYDPTEVIASAEGPQSNVISRDYTCYSEAFIPKYPIFSVDAESMGGGEYDIVLRQNISRDGYFRNSVGRLTRNRLKMYDLTLITKPYSNAFVLNNSAVRSDHILYGIDTDKDYCRECLENLDDNKTYFAYVTLDNVYDYDSFTALWDDGDDFMPEWIALCTRDDEGYFADGVFGCQIGGSCMSFPYDEDKYPQLAFIDTMAGSGYFPDKDSVTAHAQSLYKYLSQQKDFAEIFDIDASAAGAIADNIAENGLNIYGFTISGTKQQLLSLLDSAEIAYVNAEPY